jgi:hypothetical protein
MRRHRGDKCFLQVTKQSVMQKPLIEKHFPCFECRLWHRHLECEGLITPSENCATYRVAISYEQDGFPRVKIKDPQIVPSSAIHMFRNGDLCLYKPTEILWKSSDNIHEKIVPWIAEWLVFYELYLMCGRWLGPEVPHGAGGKVQQKNRSVCEDGID